MGAAPGRGLKRGPETGSEGLKRGPETGSKGAETGARDRFRGG